MTETTPPRIFPALRYRNPRAAIDWLVRAFGFEPQAIYDTPDGGVAHAEIRFGTAVVGLSTAGAVDTANPWTQVKQGIYVQLPAVDRHHDQARAAGAEVVRPLQDMDYGSRNYSARDVGGHLWDFGTYAMGGAGESDLSIGLRYDDGEAAVAFLERAFGFAPALIVRGADGRIGHAEMRLGDGVVLISPGAQAGNLWNGDRQCAYLALSDPDAHYARAVAAGAAIVQPPADTSYGARGYYARDPEGFLWGFSTYRPGR